MPAIMRLYEDVLSNAQASPLSLPAVPRMIFLVQGSATIGGRAFNEGEVWHGEDALAVAPGAPGATWWRFELAGEGAADGHLAGASRQKLAANTETLPSGELLLRGDSVA